MSYAKLGMAAIGAAAAYGLSRGQGRRASQIDHSSPQSLRDAISRLDCEIAGAQATIDAMWLPEADPTHTNYDHEAERAAAATVEIGRDFRHQLAEALHHLEAYQAHHATRRGRRNMDAFDSLEPAGPNKYELHGPNIDGLDDYEYEAQKDRLAPLAKQVGLSIPGVTQVEAYYEGKGMWVLHVTRKAGHSARGRRAAHKPDFKRQGDGSYLWSRTPSDGGSVLIKKERVWSKGREATRWAVYHNSYLFQSRSWGWSRKGPHFRTLAEAKRYTGYRLVPLVDGRVPR